MMQTLQLGKYDDAADVRLTDGLTFCIGDRRHQELSTLLDDPC